MSHSHHFLSRLDRVSLPHVELALHLYRAHDLLRFILDRVRLPETAERVALSLQDPERGPFLVVTREGRFVTCLGEDMTVADLPVVTRAQIDSIAAKHGELQHRVETCRKLVGPGRKTSDLLLRIYDAGDGLSQEEFVGISAMEPLLRTTFVELQLQAADDLDEGRERLLRLLKRTEHPRSVHRPLLLAYWKTFWAVAHMTVLSAMGGREWLEMVGDKVPSMQTVFSSCSFQQGILATAVRGIWAAARIGKILLPNYKQAYARADNHFELLESGSVLIALGMRHAKLRAEARKALGLPPQFDETPRGKYFDALAGVIVKIGGLGFDEPEAAMGYHRAVGAAMAVGLTKDLPASSPLRFARAEDVPADLAYTLAVNNRAEFVYDVEPITTLLAFLPWLAKAQAENLYLPQKFVPLIHGLWTPESTIRLLRGFTKKAERTAQAPRPAGPTRNGPCPCGSGKKYKRCCGPKAETGAAD